MRLASIYPRYRRLVPEIMDQPGLGPLEHGQALAGLERINSWSAVTATIWHHIRPLLEETPDSPLRVLDVASGGGDIAIKLWQRADRTGYALNIEGWDRSKFAVQYAQDKATRKGANVHFFERDVFSAAWDDTYDVIISSLFLHHLDDTEAIVFLKRMRSAARRLILVSDLLRSTVGLLLAIAGTRMLSASPVVRVDGPRSVRRAFTPGEVRALAEQAGLFRANIVWQWPFRFLLWWSPVNDACRI
jgi:2-polyprenyl-3-methyl-5-hydroxy-6-metoxy-1,4-benzoquinol methylase